MAFSITLVLGAHYPSGTNLVSVWGPSRKKFISTGKRRRQWSGKLSSVVRLERSCLLSGGSRGGAWVARAPLIFRPNWGPKGRKKIFWRPPPPLVSGSGWPALPPPPAYLRVWIRHCYCQVLNKKMFDETPYLPDWLQVLRWAKEKERAKKPPLRYL